MSPNAWLVLTTVIFAIVYYLLWKIPFLEPNPAVRRGIVALGVVPALSLEAKYVNEFLSIASVFGMLLGMVAGHYACKADDRIAAALDVKLAARQRALDEKAAEEKTKEAERQRELDEAAALIRRDEMQAEKARLREERERSAAVQALHAHLGVITGAVRAIRTGADNTVLITTIDEELKTIGRNPKISEDMLIAPDIREEVELIRQALSQRGVDDRILLNRLHKLFGIGTSSTDATTTGPLSA